MSYNVLATSLTDHFEYGCNPEYLKPENRIPAIKEEIQYINPDILCLQEVEEHTGLMQYLQLELGYEG